MSSRSESKVEKDRQKQLQDKCQALLTQMLRDDDNKYCVDCDAKGPRWASWNLGVFLCIRCAGIHRNLGVHISKVKSVNLDSWTPEQVVSLQQMGNSRARAVYEATLPDTWRRPQTDASLEAFIRAKYQHKRYIAKEWVPPPLPKVDWDKELDEEAERQKKKKKEKQPSTTVLPTIKKNVPVPALPKPASSPKSNRTSSITADENKQSSAFDLLGLNNTTSTSTVTSNNSADDAFSSFLGGPIQTSTATSTNSTLTESSEVKGRTAEEDSFFNQPTLTNEPKKPLSKDSILALYASQSVNVFQSSGLFPGNPGIGYPPTGPTPVFPQNAAGFPLVNSSGLAGPNATSFPPSIPFVNGVPLQQQTSIPSGNPFFGMSMGVLPQAIPVQHGSKENKRSNDHLADVPASLPQQMATLNLGQPVTAAAQNFAAAFPPVDPNYGNPTPQSSMGQTFTTHLWQ